jgi:hypothetical protein
MAALLNQYRLFIYVELVFDSPQDFLYRQKGQLKLDNSVIEEFLPHLVRPEVLAPSPGPAPQGHGRQGSSRAKAGPARCPRSSGPSR